MKSTLLVATGNPGKINEIKAILRQLDLRLVSPADISLVVDVQETGISYAQNAILKAEAYHQASGLPVLADDSGLEVEVLDGAPGVLSARFSPRENATDADRRAYLVQRLQGKARPWKAHFHCTAILLLPGGKIVEKNGRCDGVIITEEKGIHGFGYDPLFYIPEFAATMAELDPAIKNQISHRANALKAMAPEIAHHLID